MASSQQNSPEKEKFVAATPFLSNKLGWANREIKSIAYKKTSAYFIKIKAQIKKDMAFALRYDKKTL
jgi:hypothetical protein